MPGLRCPKCGQPNQTQARCKNCGSYLTSNHNASSSGRLVATKSTKKPKSESGPLPVPSRPVTPAEPPKRGDVFHDSADMAVENLGATYWVHCSPLDPRRLDGEITVGRGQDNDLVLPHMEVSRNHAAIRRQDNGEVVVVDNNSANGTLLNGERISKRTIKPGDKVKIGPYEITLREERSPGQLSAKHSETKAVEPDDDTIKPQDGHEFESTMLMGKIGKISFAEILQYVEFHKKTGKLMLRAVDGTKGYVFVAAGKPLRATWGTRLKDEDAVRAMLAAHGGTFAFDMDSDAGPATMRSTLAQCILEFSRSQDERHATSDVQVSSEAKNFFDLLDGFTARRNPKSAEARKLAAKAFEQAKSGQLDAAIADFTRAIDLDPSLVSAWYNRGLARERSGDYSGAIIDYSRAIALEPTKLACWLRRGIARGDSGDYDGAIEDCTKVIAQSPLSAPAYTTRSCARREKGDLAGAIQDATRAVTIDPRLAMAWFQRGAARYRLGDMENAFTDLRKYVELAPEGPQAGKVRAMLEQMRR